MMTATVSEAVEARDGDDALLARIVAGDDAALAELYDRYGQVAFGVALRVLRDRGLAENAVQEAFLAIWRSAARFQAQRGTARAWVLSLAHRRAVDLVRREERRRGEPLPDAGWGCSRSAEEDAWLIAERRRVRAALDRLPDALRDLLELAYYGGLTQSEISARLGIPLGTVKSRTTTALIRLRELLTEDTAVRKRPVTRPATRRRGTLEEAAAPA